MGFFCFLISHLCKPGLSPCPIGKTKGMLFFSLLFILLKLKINFGRATGALTGQETIQAGS